MGMTWGRSGQASAPGPGNRKCSTESDYGSSCFLSDSAPVDLGWGLRARTLGDSEGPLSAPAVVLYLCTTSKVEKCSHSNVIVILFISSG